MDVFCKAVPAGVSRAQWLSDLDRAIDDAQWLAWRIGAVEGRNPQALELYVELELVRAEVEALRGRDLYIPSRGGFPPLDDLDALGNLAAAREWLEK